MTLTLRCHRWKIKEKREFAIVYFYDLSVGKSEYTLHTLRARIESDLVAPRYKELHFI